MGLRTRVVLLVAVPLAVPPLVFILGDDRHGGEMANEQGVFA